MVVLLTADDLKDKTIEDLAKEVQVLRDAIIQSYKDLDDQKTNIHLVIETINNKQGI